MDLSLGTIETFNLAGQDFGEPFDCGLLQDRVVVARNLMGRDAPDRQVGPASCRVILKRSALFRAEQDDASRVGGG